MRSFYKACLVGLLYCCYGSVRVTGSRGDDGLTTSSSTSSSSQLNSHSEYSSYDKKRDAVSAPPVGGAYTLREGDVEPVGVEFLAGQNLYSLPENAVLGMKHGGTNLLGYEETHRLGKSKGRKRKKKKKNRRKHKGGQRNRKRKGKVLFRDTLVESPKRVLAPEDVDLRWNAAKNTWESTDTKTNIDGPAERKYQPEIQATTLEDSGISYNLNSQPLQAVNSRQLGDLPSRRMDGPIEKEENGIFDGSVDAEKSMNSPDTSVTDSEDDRSTTSNNDQWKVFSSIRFDTYRADDGVVTTSKPIITYGNRNRAPPNTVHSYSSRNYRFNISPQRQLPNQQRFSPSRSQIPISLDANLPSRDRPHVDGGSSPNRPEPWLQRLSTETTTHGSIRKRILRNRYWTQRNSRRNDLAVPPETTQSLAHDGIPFGVDNSSGSLLNPFDQLSPRTQENPNDQPTQNPTTELPRTRFDSNSNVGRSTGYSGRYSSDNHYSFTINSTLSTPHYYRALNNINKPITPYNWRRRKLPQPTIHHRTRPGGTSSASQQADETRFQNLHDSRDLSSSESFDEMSSTNETQSNSHNESSNSVFHRNARSFDADPVPSDTPDTPSMNMGSYDQDSLNGTWNSLRPSPYTQLQPSSSSNRFSSNANPFNVRSTPYRYRSSGSRTSPPQYPTRDNHTPETTRRRFSARSNLDEDEGLVRGGRFRSSTRQSGTHGDRILEGDSTGANAQAENGAGGEEPKKRPNIVVIITDDLDVELGSLNYMPRLHALLRRQGGLFPHSYTSTPMCCPSRSSLLTGMYIHNHEVYTNNDNCSSVRWQETHEQRTFATYLSQAGYNTGYFGKYLNKYKGPYTPAGWRDWMGLRLNSRYYNYTVFKNGQKIKYGDSYPRDYFPNVITNEGIRFLRENFDGQGARPSPQRAAYSRGGSWRPPPPPSSPPVLMVLSYPAPHGPEDSAPEYSNMFFNATDHHTVAYDYAPNPDKQWILQYTDRMAPIKLKFTDLMMTKRLQTLQSVDQAIERIITELRRLDQLSNTYLFFTSDHGYHLGQFGLIKGKSMPFEFDIKVPLLVRGPGVVPSTEFAEIALNVDLAPTFLDIGGVVPPPHMDGRSLLPLLTGRRGQRRWRDSFLVESSGRHRDEDVLAMRAQKRFLQLTRLRDREVKLNSTLATVQSTLTDLLGDGDDGNGTLDYMLPLLNTSFLASSSMPEGLNESGYLPDSYFGFGFNQSDDGSFDLDGSGDGERELQLPLFTSKHEHLEEVCKSEELQAPCDEHKKWRCEHDGVRWRLKKCRPRVQLRRAHCVCGPEMGMGYLVRLDQEERRRQRTFLKQHASQDLRSLSPRFLKAFVDVDSSEVARENLRHRHARKRNRSRSTDISPDDSSRYANEVSNSIGRRTKRNRRDVGLESGVFDYSNTGTTHHTSTTSPSSSGDLNSNSDTSDEGITVEDSLPGSPYLGDYGTSYDSSGDMRGAVSTPSPEGHEQGTYLPEEREVEEAVSGVVLEDDLGDVPDLVHSYVEEEELKDIERQIHDIFDELKDLADASGNTTDYATPHDNATIIQEGAGGCVAVGGAVVDCPPSVYSDKHAWRSSKHAIDEEIRRLGDQMRLLKVIRQHLRESRPRKANSRELYPYFDTAESSEQELGETVGEDTRGTPPNGEGTRDPPPSTDSDGDTWPLQTTGLEENSVDQQSGSRSEDDRQFRRPLPDHDSGRDGPVGTGAELGTLGEFDDGEELSPSTTERVFGWNLGYDVPESGDAVTEVAPTGEDEDVDPDHFTYTGGYRGNKGSQVAVYVPRDRSVCWCNKRAALQQHVRTEKLRRMMERQQLRELRAAMRLQRRKDKQKRRGRHQKDRPCNLSHQNCYHHDNDHWKTPPLWSDGSFCACLNAANNTYWCVRTVNSTHNTLYCEFITGLITYYDLNIDPYQLRNVAFMLNNDAVAELHDTLTVLRSCRGVLQCDLVEGSRDREPTDDGNGSVILPPSTPTAGTTHSPPFSDTEDRFSTEVTSSMDAVTGLRVSLYGSDEVLNDTVEEDEDGEEGYGSGSGAQGYDGATGPTPELEWDRLGLYPINDSVPRASSVPVVHPSSSSMRTHDINHRNNHRQRGSPFGRVADNEVTLSNDDDVDQGGHFRTGQRNRTKAHKANRWALSTSTRNGTAFDPTLLPYGGMGPAPRRFNLNGRRNGGGRGNSSRRGFRRFHMTNLEDGEFRSIVPTNNGGHHRGVTNRHQSVQGNTIPLPDDHLGGARHNSDAFSSRHRGVMLEGSLLEDTARREDRRHDTSGPGRRRRPKKEQKKRRKELRRLRKEQKRKRLDSLLGESSPDPVRALSGSSLTGVTRLPRRSRQERRRLRRWRRFEKKLKQLKETAAVEPGVRQ